MASESNSRTVEEIWAEDRLDRKEEAELLLAYIESVSALALKREDAKSITISVDAGYGEGKSFFLRRFAEHLALNHPVAFVDAWTDDLADEPLTALAATLKKALYPLIEESAAFKNQWNDWIEKTGKVAKIAGFGVAKRLLGLAITSAAVSQIEELAATANEAVKEEMKGVGHRVVQGVEDTIEHVSSKNLMSEEIERFEAGRRAIAQLKSSLGALVDALDKHTLKPPIVIVIDELDRCRPTYAIKLLEEVKHLFDVPGVVFVFGMNTEQLARAVGGVYGASFEGEKYLRRFVSRQYKLQTPSMSKLLPVLLDEAGLSGGEFEFLQVEMARGWAPMPFVDLLDYYLRAYGATPRDAYQVVDRLRTCVSVVRGQKLVGPYLIPLVISKVLNISVEEGDAFPMAPAKFSYVWHPANGNLQKGSPKDVAGRIHSAATKLPKELIRALNSGGNDFAPEMVYHAREASIAGQVPLADPANYGQLIDAVGRIADPNANTN